MDREAGEGRPDDEGGEGKGRTRGDGETLEGNTEEEA